MKKHTKKFWQKWELAYVKENYANTDNSVMVKHLGRSDKSIYGAANLMGIKKSPEKLAQNGLKVASLGLGRFVKGQISHNKGKKMDATIYEKVSKTMFKKGNVPHNAKPDKHERIDNKDGYTWIRISAQKFVLKHRYIWEEAYGTIPAGHIVAFKDGNKQNCNLENLQLLTLKENMKRNSITNYPPEIHGAIIALAHFNKKVKHEKQNRQPAHAPVCHAGSPA